MTDKKRIAVIGGGIAGLTFVRCMSNDLYELHVFEKKSFFGEVGAAISMFPNALCVLDELGLLQDILKTCGQIQNVYLKTDKGTVLSKSEPRGEYPTICIHRADLHSILLNNINAVLHIDCGLKSISQRDEKTVLSFENGETMLFDAVVGADGIHSVVRNYVLNDGPPVFRGYNVWRGVVKTNFDVGYGSESFGKGKRIGIVPIKDGMYGWWVACNEKFMQSDEPETSKQKLRRLFGEWHTPIPDLFENTELILKNGVLDRKPIKGWTKGSVTLIGDAAHPTTPNLGQGGCMAVEGAYILAKSIQKYGLTSQAFSRYEELQFPRSSKIVKESLRLGKVGQLSNPILMSIRNFAFKAMPSGLTIKIIDKFFSYRVTKLDI